MSVTMAVNRAIARELERQGLRKTETARKAALSPAVLSNIVNLRRKVYADELVPIAAALGVSVEALFREEGKTEGST